MRAVFFGLVIGIVAGGIDIVPMLIARASKADIASALVHWVVVALILVHTRTALPKWAEGAILALLTAVPVIILVAPRDPKAVAPMLVMSVVLGGLSGVVMGHLLSR